MMFAKRLIGAIIAAVVMFLVCWAFGSFVSLETNVMQWSWDARGFTALFTLCAAFLIAIAPEQFYKGK